jgi:hypothetical protein
MLSKAPALSYRRRLVAPGRGRTGRPAPLPSSQEKVAALRVKAEKAHASRLAKDTAYKTRIAVASQEVRREL